VERPATLVGADDATDGRRPRRRARNGALALAGERGVSVGELVVAIGNPLGFDRSVSLGVVSALYRSLPTGPATVLEGLIQTDAAVNPGNSGGPLLDAEGRGVGITTAMVPYARGIGFAVPASTASWVAAVLIRRARSGGRTSASARAAGADPGSRRRASPRAVPCWASRRGARGCPVCWRRICCSTRAGGAADRDGLRGDGAVRSGMPIQIDRGARSAP
jgi:S1-C subfamily serine protease